MSQDNPIDWKLEARKDIEEESVVRDRLGGLSVVELTKQLSEANKKVAELEKAMHQIAREAVARQDPQWCEDIAEAAIERGEYQEQGGEQA